MTIDFVWQKGKTYVCHSAIYRYHLSGQNNAFSSANQAHQTVQPVTRICREEQQWTEACTLPVRLVNIVYSMCPYNGAPNVYYQTKHLLVYCFVGKRAIEKLKWTSSGFIEIIYNLSKYVFHQLVGIVCHSLNCKLEWVVTFSCAYKSTLIPRLFSGRHELENHRNLHTTAHPINVFGSSGQSTTPYGWSK